MALDIEKFETKNSKEKQEVIDTILGLATHNAFSKTDLLYMLRWQRDRTDKTVHFLTRIHSEKKRIEAQLQAVLDCRLCACNGCDNADCPMIRSEAEV